MKTAILVTCISLTVSACAYSVARLKSDDELRHQVIKECLKLGLKAKDETNCINAAKAQAIVAGDSINKLKDLMD